MAKKYTSKDTMILIEKHKENLKRLEDSTLLLSEFGGQIQEHISDLLFEGVFSTFVMDELEDRESGSNTKNKIDELIRLLYLYKRSDQQFNTCQAILKNNKNRIVEMMTEASVRTNAITWLFSSLKKKKLFEVTYENLAKEADDSDYWISSHEVISNIEKNDSVTAEEGRNDFKLSVREYQDNLTDNLPRAFYQFNSIYDLNFIIEKYEGISSWFDNEKSKQGAKKNSIKAAAERMVMAAVLDILKTVPVEEINRDKKGIRTKALRDAGYTTMSDLYAASGYQLSSIYGISEDASYSIKSIVKKFADEANQNAKIKLSVDNKTKEATKLISELYYYRQFIMALNKLDLLNSDYELGIKTAISDLRSVGNGVNWIFFNESKKDRIKKSYNYLKYGIRDEYERRSNEVTELFARAELSSSSDAWGDFQSNSILYYNILEEIVPGVLGNDDQLYGLPEDLAREIQEECFFPEGLNCELRRYQEWGVKYILHQERVLLGDEMGLGKTVQAIATMVSLRNTGASHFIVVCPASVLPNWCKEIAIKSKLRVTKIHGVGRTQAIRSWIKTGGVAVTTFETTGVFELDDDYKFDLLVVDEAHYIKNINAVRSKNVRQLSKYTKRILFMTGTALENRVDEMISLINVLQPNVAQNVQSIAFMSTAPEFREKIAGVYYRRKREDVLTELPDLIESREWCIMSGKETVLYEQAVLSKNYMGARRLSWNVDSLEESSKARRMMEIITEAESEGRKVLIFSFFLDTIRKIQMYLGDRCCNPINGSLQPQRRQAIIDQFNDDPKKTVLCAQIQSGGTGLNIQAASVVIICEPQFKPSIENQAISRAYRMGQARNVLVFRLLCEDTIDERITDMLEEKQAVFNAFADKSVAAANTEKEDREVDETTFGKIIEEEIERIKAKGGTVPSVDNCTNYISMNKPNRPEQDESLKCKINNKLESESKSALASSSEYVVELSMNYDQLVYHLHQKYGKVKGDYFLNDTCVSRNKKIVRTNEGLYCHHIDEDKAIMLSDTYYAVKSPFDYQKAERLVYCNILEHLILHVKIIEKQKDKTTTRGEMRGIGGALNFITPQINDYYNGHKYKQQQLKTPMCFIEDNFDDYIIILRYLWNVIESNAFLSMEITKKQLAVGSNGKIIDKIYDRL